MCVCYCPANNTVVPDGPNYSNNTYVISPDIPDGPQIGNTVVGPLLGLIGTIKEFLLGSSTVLPPIPDSAGPV